MKQTLLLFMMVLCAGFITSCGGDEDCETTDINQIILGNWTFEGDDLTFNADGSIDDPNNVFEGEINGIVLDQDSYTLEGDTVLIIRTFSIDPPAALSLDYTILEYDCNEILLEVFIAQQKLKRK